MSANRMQRLLAEGGGTAVLLAVVVGSGMMGEHLAQGNTAVALFANAAATGAALYVLITLLAPFSGAHFNPLVTVLKIVAGEMSVVDGICYVAVQVAGAVAGVVLAHAMFDLPLLQAGTHARVGIGQWISECVASAGLLGIILLGQGTRPAALPGLIGSYIFAAYWFTASTAFANPAVTIARTFTDSFAGIRSSDVLGFIAAQFSGLLVAILAMYWLRGRRPNDVAAAANVDK